MTLYNWLTLLGVPGMIAGLLTFIRLQVRQNQAVREGLQALLEHPGGLVLLLGDGPHDVGYAPRRRSGLRIF